MAKKKTSLRKRIDRKWRDLKSGVVFRLKRILQIVMICVAILGICLIALIFLYSSPTINPHSTLMLGRLISFQPVSRDWMPLDKINPVLVHSVLMSEDARFCAHNGVDWDALNQVIDDAIEGEKSRGASTLSMQVVKNLFLWPGRSYVRKALELPIALVADWAWSKRRMVEIYLNIAEWDAGVFGIEAAARHYFGRSAKNLSARQSALLAVTLPNPVRRNPAKPGKTLQRLGKNIEKRAFQSGAYVKCLK